MMKILTGLVVAALATPFVGAETLPDTIRAWTARLEFRVSSPQASDSFDRELKAALSEIRHVNGARRIVKLRVFVAAGSDAGKVAGAAEAIFSKAHLPLPVVNVIQVGALEGGARVLIESIAEAKKTMNPNGLAFISGQLTQTPKEGGKLSTALVPLAEKSIAGIRTALGANALVPADVLRLTCYTSSLGDSARLRAMVAAAFPKAPLGIVQLEREAASNEVECESVARLKTKPAEPVLLVNPTKAQFAQMALVGAPQVVFTSTAAGANDDAGIRHMFTSLGDSLETGGSSLGKVFYTHGYPANLAMVQKFRDIRWEFLDKTRAPASTNLVFEGVPPAGSGAGIDAIALPR